MRRPVLLLLIAAIVALGAGAAILFNRYEQTSTALAQARASEQDARQHYATTIDAIAEIQDSLNAIAVGDANVALVPGGLESEKGLTPPDGRDALDRIANLRASIQRSKDRIHQLESSLNVRGGEVTSLRRIVAQLKTSVSEKEGQITELSDRVNNLQTQVSGLETTVQENTQQIAVRDAALEAKRKEIATVYYAVGTRKDLTTRGLVVAKGGVLGLGKTLAPAPTAATAAMLPLDTDQQTVVAIDAPKAWVVSAQPTNSYELRLVDGKMELHILDTSEFRKIKQLVIVTA